jgi:rSAM/selenodomain-associated transferase 2
MEGKAREASGYHRGRMPERVTVIIPSLNEAPTIAAAIDSAFAAGAAEVLVADGGSEDDTVKLAAWRGARVLTGQRVRASQLNAAAREAAGEVLLFLHADTLLPAGACSAAAEALAAGREFGGFRLRFAEDAPKLRLAAWMINLRTRLTRRPWGDQAQFVRRDDFLAAGGFRELAILEDYELAARMRRRVLLPLTVTTSGRRFLQKGLLRTAAINWRIIIAWRLGADAAKLARLYRGR